ncbi:uncharacterized protein MONOS_8152 [Monocercomonoides exilis]|uniref:uncharacterized protein n=1 Tax=Monocercomonoides exilis TaxID=2049356 RepID=UPI00355A2557|nr:hypothetical protein MONOS_8152 [Monocercomonoides exilis]|eukprot:MONOS_8152.1-p1 / transcript=MONOS_8152.1 / gene=MONOS_8152 / organism=Monocercomonoides_exilis_PA203 / gene_product=unspecified product / transcript_product=unspecified product / location=Mono_scaffold00298:62044-62385(+) / protein_length=114 / sequence_SO=supercontig / SO=protein_coding / is_pseudo=false
MEEVEAGAHASDEKGDNSRVVVLQKRRQIRRNGDGCGEVNRDKTPRNGFDVLFSKRGRGFDGGGGGDQEDVADGKGDAEVEDGEVDGSGASRAGAVEEEVSTPACCAGADALC